MITQEIIELLWNNASRVDGKNPEIWRHDPCGALIKKDDYGNRASDYGWEVDHIVSRAFLQQAGATNDDIDYIDNLRAMHWANNDSKGKDYPEYKAIIRDVDGVNKSVEGFYTVNKARQETLHVKFSKYGI